ncbi:Dabb family protein [Amycolatopsis coloradensis]|uniref:Dabb family protein n=1 Tax=Amycolatopsis coloradensis TaxID=76021 RepID=A0ACD5BIX6_9PSEU
MAGRISSVMLARYRERADIGDFHRREPRVALRDRGRDEHIGADAASPRHRAGRGTADVAQVVAGLLVGGFGVGFVVPNLNLRLAEFAHPAHRGRVLSGLVAAIFLGHFLSPIVVQPLVPGHRHRRRVHLDRCRPGRRSGTRRSPPEPEQRKGNTMIYHGNRFTLRPDASPEQVEEALESLRSQGRVIPSVKSFVVGRDLGGDYEWGAVFAIEDLDGVLGVPRAPGAPEHRPGRSAAGRQVRVL